MSKGEIPATIEYEVSAHLRHVELLGMPDLSAQGKPDVTPDRAGRRDREQTSPSTAQTLVAQALGIGEPPILSAP
jgi:hypothetical protein